MSHRNGQRGAQDEADAAELSGNPILLRSSIVPGSAKTSRYPAVVLALLFLATFINFLDRQTLSIAAPLLRDQFGISSVGYSRIVFAFLLGYTASQTLAGKLIDRIGTRRGMMIFVAAWSIAATLQGLAIGFVSLCLARILLGIAEAGNWPAAVKAVSETMAPEQRGLAVGVFNSGAFVAAIVAPPLLVGLIHVWGWRIMFFLVGMTGLMWIWLWAALYKPRAWRAVPIEQLDTQGRLSVLSYMRKPAIWGLIIGRFLADPVWWFYAFWLPEYFVRGRGFNLASLGKVLWVPFLFAALGSWFGGYISGVLIRRGHPPILTRKLVMVAGASLMLLGVPAFFAHNALMALGWICLVLFGYSGWAANILSLPADLFPSQEVARVTGLVGTGGAIGGMIFTLATGWLVENISYAPVFILAAAMIICAATAVVRLVPAERLSLDSQ